MPAFPLQDDCQILYILLHINESYMMIKAQTTSCQRKPENINTYTHVVCAVKT